MVIPHAGDLAPRLRPRGVVAVCRRPRHAQTIAQRRGTPELESEYGRQHESPSITTHAIDKAAAGGSDEDFGPRVWGRDLELRLCLGWSDGRPRNRERRQGNDHLSETNVHEKGS